MRSDAVSVQRVGLNNDYLSILVLPGECQSSGRFYCEENGLCIDGSLRCDQQKDCLNGSDEQNCG